MAAKTEKPENDTTTAPSEPSDKELRTDLKLARGDLRELKQKFNALESNYKREKSKREKLEAERPSPKEDRPADSNATTASSTATPAKNITATADNSTAEAHVEHSMEWVPPFCGEHGCKNDLFKDEVVCNNCNGPLGSEHYAKHQLKACPLCGENKGYKPKQGYTLKHDGCIGSDCKVKA